MSDKKKFRLVLRMEVLAPSEGYILVPSEYVPPMVGGFGATTILSETDIFEELLESKVSVERSLKFCDEYF